MPIIKSQGPPIRFPAVQVLDPSPNALDDYEEGAWTPVLTFETPGDVSVAYSIQLGNYTKIGRLVSVQCHIDTSSFTHTTASGPLMINGLPFNASGSQAANIWVGSLQFAGIELANFTQLHAQIEAFESFIGARATQLIAAFNEATINASDVPTGGNVILRVGIQFHI